MQGRQIKSYYETTISANLSVSHPIKSCAALNSSGRRRRGVEQFLHHTRRPVKSGSVMDIADINDDGGLDLEEATL